PSERKLPERKSANSAFALEGAEEEQPAEDGVAAVPRFDFDGHAGVAGDFPCKVIDAAGEGGCGLDEAKHGEQLALQAAQGPRKAAPQALQAGGGGRLDVTAGQGGGDGGGRG